MQSPNRNVSLLPQSMLIDAHLLRALIDLLESTESSDILELVCIALTGIISHAPAAYDTVLARGIVRIGVTRIRQLSSSNPHLSTLLATVVFMSKHQPPAPKTTYSALGPSSRSNDGPYIRTDSEIEWRNYNFNDGPVSFASAIPLIASHIDDIEQHFKDCLLSVDDHKASTLVAAGLTGVAGLIGSGMPVSVFSDTAVVSRIAYHLSRGVPEAVRLVEVVNKHGSVAAKNTIKAALPDFQVVIGDVVHMLSSLSAGTNDTVVLINQLDMIARLYSFDTSLRTSILDSMLIGLLLQLLRDGEAESGLILAAIRTLASVAQSTLSPPPGDTLARIVATLVDVVRRFDHIGLVQLAVDELYDLKFASVGLHHVCSQNPVHIVLLERFDQLGSGTDHPDALESTLAVLSTLIDRDDHAAVAVATCPGLAASLYQLSCETAKPSLAATALRLWHQLLVKELIALSLAEQDQFVSSAISLASHPSSTAYETGIALEALYAVCNDLTLADRQRIVALCRKLFQGSGHFAVLRPAGIVLDAAVRTLAADDAERTVIFSDIATALDPSTTR
ncbi:hypothetical protein GQ42DRAFT_64307 [Ramicandelaber brevisporus]|nr:hypothetical protein GQ42DRAFT_64307 [Ramicandelaber brevisporus]